MHKDIRRTFYVEYTKGAKRSTIEYKFTCLWCSTDFWCRKKNTQYCSNACRALVCIENKKNL